MKRSEKESSRWEATVDLPVRGVEFKFLVDDTWRVTDQYPTHFDWTGNLNNHRELDKEPHPERPVEPIRENIEYTARNPSNIQAQQQQHLRDVQQILRHTDPEHPVIEPQLTTPIHRPQPAAQTPAPAPVTIAPGVEIEYVGSVPASAAVGAESVSPISAKRAPSPEKPTTAPKQNVEHKKDAAPKAAPIPSKPSPNQPSLAKTAITTTPLPSEAKVSAPPTIAGCGGMAGVAAKAPVTGPAPAAAPGLTHNKSKKKKGGRR
ncbi:hypothetical protein HDV00_005147 [Rhizophlyctis rosea]|nr:hypothetical protein HDV00_005147 [Rhizophlyctis rosea]